MFHSISSRRLGAVRLSPIGATHVRAPSRAGKTLLAQDLVLLLTGRDVTGSVPSVRDGIEVAATVKTAKDSYTLMRILRRDGQSLIQERAVSVDNGEPTPLATERDLWEWLSARKTWSWAARRQGEDPKPWVDRCVETVRLVVPGVHGVGAPPWWTRLADGPGNGRALVEALLRTVDTRAAIPEIIQGLACYRSGDPVGEKQAVEARRLAGNRLERTQGNAESARRALDGLATVTHPGQDAVAHAQATLAAEVAWSTYRQRSRDVYTRAAWLRRREAIGEEPAPVDADTMAAARKALKEAERAEREAIEAVNAARVLVGDAQRKAPSMQSIEMAREDVRRAEDALRFASGAVQRIEAAKPKAPEGGCPRGGTCDLAQEANKEALARWVSERTRLESAQKEAQRRLAAESERVTRLEEVYRVQAEEAARLVKEATEAIGPAVQRLSDRESAVLVAREVVENLESRMRELEAWSRALRSLGPEPPDVAPMERPDCDPPTPEDVASARATLEQATRADGASSYAETQRADAAQAVETAEAAVRAAAEEHQRLDSLVKGIQSAPGQLLPYAIQALGDMGPVSIVGDGQGCRVLVNRYPWQEASAGELIYADLCLRLALRRALGCTWLPVVIDNCQDWSGTWPTLDEGRPSIWLHTEVSQ